MNHKNSTSIPVDEAGQSLVAGEANRFWIVVWPHSAGYVREYHLPSTDIPRAESIQ